MGYRTLETKFWADSWIRELNPLDRYLFLYLLQNSHTNICGIYELPIATMSFETGIEREELLRSMLPRLAPKIFYKDNWVIVMNFQKHQATSSSKVQEGINNGMRKVPADVLDFYKKQPK